jgi:chemotaxis protein MotB
MRIETNDGNWEVTYTGFVLILLTLFILLCSFSTMEESKLTRFVKSFVTTLSVLPRGVKQEQSKVVIPHSVDMVEIESELAKIQHELNTYSQTIGVGEEVIIQANEKELCIRISDSVLFDLGSSGMSPKGLPLLDKVLELFCKTSYEILIEGHTDNLPIHTSQYPSNWELSTTRAVNVLRYFLAKGQIPGNRVSALGYGEFQPISPNDTPENRVKNRRVEILLSRIKKADSLN